MQLLETHGRLIKWKSPNNLNQFIRAQRVIECLEVMHNGLHCENEIVLPVELVKRKSTRVL